MNAMYLESSQGHMHVIPIQWPDVHTQFVHCSRGDEQYYIKNVYLTDGINTET